MNLENCCFYPCHGLVSHLWTVSIIAPWSLQVYPFLSIPSPSHSYSSVKTNVCIWLTSSMTNLSYNISPISHISSHYQYQLSLAPSFSQSTFPSLLFVSTFYLALRTNSVGVFSATSSLVLSLFRNIPSSVAMTHCFC